jgi:imidazolonepropionase-like amidohydrolase
MPDATVIPGLVAAASDLGGNHQGDESLAAGYRAVDQFDPFHDFAKTLAAGVTTVHLDPGRHRLLTGQGAVVKLGGPASDRILRAAADLVINLSPAAHKPPPDVTFPFPASADVAILPAEPQRPVSRLDQLLALDEALRDALAKSEAETFRMHRRALAAAWRAELPLRFGVAEPADVLAAFRFLRQHERAGYLVGGPTATRAADAIAAAGVPFVYQPLSRFRAPGGDIGTDPDAVTQPELRALTACNVLLALAPPPGQDLGDLRLTAIQAVQQGLEPERALQAVTHAAAQILGVADRVGSLEPGKDADLVVMTGDPLAASSHVQRVYIQGREVFHPPDSAALVVKAAVIWTGPGQWIRDGQLLVEDGKIVAVGRSVPHPPFARVIDVRPDGFVTPGFIDAHSHLGLEGDRSEVGTDLRLSQLVGVADVTETRVAAAGITTVLVAPYRAGSKGATVAALKTAGRLRDQRVIRDPAAVLLDVSRSDPLEIPKQLGDILAAGQKYLDSWTKYDKDLQAFLDKQKQGEEPAEGEGPKTEPKDEAVKESTEPDPVTGTWELTVTGIPMPEPIRATAVLQLNGSTVTGRIPYSSVGLTGRVNGSFDGTRIAAEIEPDVPVPGLNPPIQLQVDLAGEDRAKGTISAMGITAQVDASRVDKKAPELQIVSRRRETKDGRPLPPKIDPALEPLKALLEKKIPALVRADSAAQIREVLADLVDKRQLPITLLNAEQAAEHAAKLAEKKVAVLVPPQVLRTEFYRDYHQADDLARSGVPIGFQSDVEDGARHLPAVVLYAVERGLDAETALAALTLNAAKALRIDDRVGTLDAGKDADLVIFSGHPFLEAGRVLRVIVDGKEVPQ